jgi:hypothetical protein
MKVEPPSAHVGGELKKIGQQLTTDWLKKAGADGKAIIDAFNKP